ncbi:MAG: DUF3467 domain-containing protein [Methanothrix sp.]|jgi:outer membrane lipoprotein-sorting protein|nr:DUF3467 domain-containing protein [Methanothrix sp.]
MEVKVETTKSPDFKQVYAIGAIGGHSPYDFRIAFYNDSPKTMVEDGRSITVMERKIDTEIILSPLAAKELSSWLAEHVKDYEKVFGEIKRPGSGPNSPADPKKGSESAAIQGYM